MKSMMGKTTVREIKGSFSRWFAILAICALGVGFFVGLKVSKEAFVKTGDQYLSKLNFFDFEVISTLGIEEKNIDELKETAHVKAVEGSYSTDCLITVTGEKQDDSLESVEVGEQEDGAEGEDTSKTDALQRGDKVAKAYSLMDEINLVELVSGRMPETDRECVVDYDRFSESDIGLTIRMSELNDEDTLDMFKYDEYEIVGLVSSPLYLNFERGSTSLGDGTVNCYIYIPKEGWDMEVYTEAYISMEEKDTIFTDEYDTHADELEDILADKFDAVAMSRYDEIMEDADKEISDAEDKITEAKADLKSGEKKIADNEKKLADAKAEISDGEKEIADAKAEIEENEKKLEEGQVEIDKARAELDEKAAELEKNKAYLPQSQYDAYKTQIDAGYAEIEVKEKEIADGYLQIEEGKAEIEKNEKKLEDAKKDVKDGEKKIADAKIEIKDGKKDLAEGEKELEDAKEEVADIEKPDTYVLGRDTNIGFACFENDTDIVDGMAKVFPIFFFLVAALVVMTTMTRMIDEQRTQIGVLKALGYSRRRIMSKYIWYSFSASIIGGVGGFYLGSWIFPWVIWEAYGMMYGFAELTIVFNYVVGGISVLVAVLCAVGTTILSCRADLREVPAELIRPKAPAVGKRILLERIGFIWNRMSFLHKVSARNIFRYKKRFFMMVLGICGCTALLATGMGISDSIKNVVSAQYEDIYKVDYIATFKDDISEENKSEFLNNNSRAIHQALFAYTISADARHNEITKSVNLIVCDDTESFGNFIDLHTVKGAVNKGEKTPLDYPKKGECIINSNLADNLELQVGDTIRITDSDMNELSAKVVGLCENHIYNYMYISKDTYEEHWGTYEPNSAFIIGYDDENEDGIIDNVKTGAGYVGEAEDGTIDNAGTDNETIDNAGTVNETGLYYEKLITDKSEGGALIMNDDLVSAVSVTKDFADRVNNMMKALDYVILLVIVCAGLLAFIVLYNLTNINITERIREIATIKVLGFYPLETSEYVFRENIVLTAISALVGLPLGKALHFFVMSQVQIDLLTFDVHIEPLSYVLSVVMTFLFAIIVNFVMHFKLQKINMAESLKSIE